MENVRIVKMQKEHVRAVESVERKCFSDPWTADGIEYECGNENAFFVVATKGDKILGYAGMHCVMGEAYVANIAVLPEFRRCKVGEKLLTSLVNYAQENHFLFVTLEVRESNRVAINLYKKLGFEQNGWRRDFYKNPREDAVLMTKNLERKETPC